jgi:hypothetical protein
MGRISLSVGLLTSLVACSPTKTVTADDLRSDLRLALSLASETELFIGQIESGRLAQEFRRGHADYLRDEAQRQARDLRKSRTESGDTRLPSLCATQLDLLARVLEEIREQSGDGRLRDEESRVETIKQTITAATTER